MKKHMSYDCTEAPNVKAFSALPGCAKAFINNVQARIQEEVEKKNPGKFLPTSGFRSTATNSKYAGQPQSLHLVGCARDFVPIDGIFSNPPIADEHMFIVRRSPRAWHVEYRG